MQADSPEPDPLPLTAAQMAQAVILYRHVKLLRARGKRLALVNTETLKVGHVEGAVDILSGQANIDTTVFRTT
jgi:hypothetical protein